MSMKKVFWGIFILMTKWNFMLSWVEHEKSFITSKPGFLVWAFANLYTLFGHDSPNIALPNVYISLLFCFQKRKMIAWLDAIFLFLVTKTIAQPRPSQVCLLVPPETDACYREFQGTTVTERAAQVNCLQKLLWNFQENNTMTGKHFVL